MTGGVLQYPLAINAPEILVWNNAAFDDGLPQTDDLNLKSPSSSWWSRSLDSKENLSPVPENPSPVPPLLPSSIPSKPLQSNANIVNSAQGNSMKMAASSKKCLVPKNFALEDEKEKDDLKRIDIEIEVIEREISRLSTRLEALRLEKAEKCLRRGRVVPARFAEQKQSLKIEESLILSEKSKINNRRGVSLGPVEILSGAKTRFSSKPEATPASAKNRRLSCYWKIGEIDELKVTKEKGKSMTMSPRSRKKIQTQKHAVTTAGSKRPMKKDDGLLATIQPKTLFKDGEKSAPAKKQTKAGRVVASRYHQIATNKSNDGSFSEARKRSLPDSDKEEGNKRRASRDSGKEDGNKTRASRDGGAAAQKTETGKGKKKWEIPSEAVMYKAGGSNAAEKPESPPSVSTMADVLPKIRTSRSVAETPRDSGPAKRVADLVGMKSFFSVDDEDAAGSSLVQTLTFVEEE